MNDAVRFVDQYAGRSDLFDSAAMHRSFAERHGRAYGAAELDDVSADTHRSQQTRQQARLVARDRCRLIEAGGAIHAAEQARWILSGLGAAEENIPARIKRVMERA